MNKLKQATAMIVTAIIAKKTPLRRAQSMMQGALEKARRNDVFCRKIVR